MLPSSQHPKEVASFTQKCRPYNVRLRLAELGDAAFILSLRTNEDLNKNISTTSVLLEDQKAWMRAYAERHVSGNENYFIIQHEATPVGTVRTYDYLIGENSFCWGSWIIAPSAGTKVSVSSALAIYDLAFGPLDFARAHFDVRQDNQSVWRFHERMGATLVHQNEVDRFYHYHRADYAVARVHYAKYALPV